LSNHKPGILNNYIRMLVRAPVTQVNGKTIKFVFYASPLSTHHYGLRAKKLGY